MKKARERMNEIMEMDVMKTSLLDDKMSLRVKSKIDSVRKQLEENFKIETEADVAYKAKSAEAKKEAERFRGEDLDDEW